MLQGWVPKVLTGFWCMGLEVVGSVFRLVVQSALRIVSGFSIYSENYKPLQYHKPTLKPKP